MSLKRYFDILGLPETASSSEVRKRYRALAMRLHPDKNPSKEAKDQFIKITEAYDILLGKNKSTQTSKKTTKTKTTQEDRIKEARMRYQDQQRKEALENERYYQSLIHGKKWKLIHLNALVGLALSLLLISDLFLPSVFEDDRVTAYALDVYRGTGGKSISLLKTEQEKEIWVENVNFTLYAYYPEIYIERSRIFRDPIHVISKQKTKLAYFKARYTFRSATIPVVLVFLIPIFTIYFKRKTVVFTLFWHLSLYLTGLVIVFFLIYNNHWLHLLSFGRI
jgi:ElaB/YqjD/DUF883 family membrane-anchored ribosome-binding protein